MSDATDAVADLRILTHGLDEEEIAAVTSVVAAMLEERLGTAEPQHLGDESTWRRSLGAVAPGARGPAAWRRSTR